MGRYRAKSRNKKKKRIALCAPPNLGVEGGVSLQCPKRETCLGSGDASVFENGACRTATTSICMSGQLVVKSKIQSHTGSTKQPCPGSMWHPHWPKSGTRHRRHLWRRKFTQKYRLLSTARKIFHLCWAMSCGTPTNSTTRNGEETPSVHRMVRLHCASLQATCVCYCTGASQAGSDNGGMPS